MSSTQLPVICGAAVLPVSRPPAGVPDGLHDQGGAVCERASRTTTTGHAAWIAAYRLTEPSTIAVNGPLPREPTTSNWASSPQSVTATGGRSGQQLGVNRHARRDLRSPLGGGVQRALSAPRDDIGDAADIAETYGTSHPRLHFGSGYDPQRCAASFGFLYSTVNRLNSGAWASPASSSGMDQASPSSAGYPARGWL
jgi:hypothetical protein